MAAPNSSPHQCKTTDDLRPVSDALLAKVKDTAAFYGNAAGVPGATSGLKCCDACRSHVMRTPMPFRCSACTETAWDKRGDQPLRLGVYAREDHGEDAADRVCTHCHASRKAAAAKLRLAAKAAKAKAAVAAGPNAKAKGPGRKSRAAAGMSGPNPVHPKDESKAKKHLVQPVCPDIRCGDGDCHDEMYHFSPYQLIAWEAEVLMPLLDRVVCVAQNDDGGTCGGRMELRSFREGYAANGQFNLRCTACGEQEQVQTQRDLLPMWAQPKEVPAPGSDAVRGDARVTPTKPPKGTAFGGVRKGDAETIVSSNTAFSLRLATAAKICGIAPLRLHRALALGGIGLPPSNLYESGGINRLVTRSVQEATLLAHKLVKETIKRRSAGDCRFGWTELVVAGDTGWHSARDSVHGTYVVVEAGPNCEGVGIVCLVTMSRNTTAAYRRDLERFLGRALTFCAACREPRSRCSSRTATRRRRQPLPRWQRRTTARSRTCLTSTTTRRTSTGFTRGRLPSR